MFKLRNKAAELASRKL